MKNQHTLHISGVDLTLTSEHEEEYVQMIASELSRRINNLALSQLGVTKLEAAIVCALDLLDENCRLKLELDKIKKGEAHEA